MKQLYFIDENEGWAISNYKKVLHTELEPPFKKPRQTPEEKTD